MPFEVTEAEQEAVKVYKLDRIPPSLEAQFTAFRDWRLEALNYQRAGNAVVDVTQANDRSTTLRFLAHCKAVKDLEPSLSVFGTAALPDLVQDWLKHANERGLMWSTLSNCERAAILPHAKPLALLSRSMSLTAVLPPLLLISDVNSLINITGYVWEILEVEEAAMQAMPQPPDALINLRSQCENQSKLSQLYAKKPDNWLDWEKAQVL